LFLQAALLRQGYVSPRSASTFRAEYSNPHRAVQALRAVENRKWREAGLSLAIYADMKEGFGIRGKRPWCWRW
jgi:hypothetical protein